MKKKFLMSLIVMAALLGCKKDNDNEDEISLKGKWTIENSILKDYVNGVLIDTETEPGLGTTIDFQNNGNVVVITPGEPVETLPYTIKPDSKVDIDGDIAEIRNLTAATVTLFFRDDYGAGDYAEIFLNLKR